MKTTSKGLNQIPNFSIILTIVHLIRHHYTLSITIILFLFISLYSQKDTPTSIDIILEENEIILFTDNKKILQETLEGMEETGKISYLQKETKIPFLPDKHQLNQISIKESDNIILKEEFQSKKLNESIWEKIKKDNYHLLNEAFITNDGKTKLTTKQGDFSNFHLNATIENTQDFDILLREKDSKNYLRCTIRPIRDFDIYCSVVKNGEKIDGTKSYKVFLHPNLTAQRIVKIIFSPFYYFFLTILIVIMLTKLINPVKNIFPKNKIYSLIAKYDNNFKKYFNRKFVKIISITILAVLSLTCFLWTSHITINYLEGIPHVQDSVVMLFQSKLLANFQLWATPPETTFFDFNFMHDKDGRLFGQYLFGYPIFLTIGQWLNTVKFMPALAGTLLLIITFLISKKLTKSYLFSFLTTIILFSSPFYQMSAPNFMSHTVGSLYLATSMFTFILFNEKKTGWLLPSISGVCLGILMNTRPLTMLAASAGFLLYGIIALVTTEEKKKLLKQYLIFSAGIAFFAILLLTYNYILMGDPLKLTYGNPAKKITSQHFSTQRLSKAFIDSLTLISLFLMVALNWSVSFASGISLFSLINTRKQSTQERLKTFFPHVIMVSVCIAYMFYSMSSATIMYGPRYYFEILFLFTIIITIGIKNIISLVKNPHIRKGITLLTFIIILFLSGKNLHCWTQKTCRPWSKITYVPQNIYDLKGFNHVRPKIQKLVEEKKIHNAVIIVETEKNRKHQWWQYGSVFFENNTTFDNSIVYAKDTGKENNTRLLSYYPNRTYYMANYENNNLQQIDSTLSPINHNPN